MSPRHHGRHRASDHPDTLAGDVDFFGLNHTQRQHYYDRNFTHRWTHHDHHSRGYHHATYYWAAGWITFLAAAATAVWWVIG